jgi:hypothetical protein
MIRFFFYDKLTNIELIKKISDDFTINDGYVMIQNKDNLLENIGDKIINNNLLYGKIVYFNMNIYDVLKKINEINECRNNTKTKYTINSIIANKNVDEKYQSYIIY